MLPFRDVFTSLFFVSIGMLLDLDFAARHIVVVTVATVAVLLCKTVAATGAVLVMGLPFRIALLTGIALCQVGEFSFVLSATGLAHGLLSRELYQTFLVVSLVTMAAAPFLLQSAHRDRRCAGRLPLPKKLVEGRYTVAAPAQRALRDHVVNRGATASSAARWRAAPSSPASPTTIVEINHDTVRAEQARGEPIAYGDATQAAVLEHAVIDKAGFWSSRFPTRSQRGASSNSPTGCRRPSTSSRARATYRRWTPCAISAPTTSYPRSWRPRWRSSAACCAST